MLISNASLYYANASVESLFNAQHKIYGRNMWLLTNFFNDHGVYSQNVLDAKGQHRRLTVTQVATNNLVSGLAQNLLPNANGVSDYDTTKTYTASFWLLTSLTHIRLYLYFGATGNYSNQLVYRQINTQPNVWQQLVFTGLIPPTSNGVGNRSLIGVRLNQGEYAASLIGHTVEIKDLKFELGEQSPYSYHPSLF